MFWLSGPAADAALAAEAVGAGAREAARGLALGKLIYDLKKKNTSLVLGVVKNQDGMWHDTKTVK